MAHCQRLGGSLAKMDSAMLNVYVRGTMIQGTPSFWAGGTEQGEAEGDWKWMDGTRFNYTNWNLRKNQPDNAQGVDEECLMVGYAASTSQSTVEVGLRDTSWYDVPCCLELPYVCEAQAPKPVSHSWTESVGYCKFQFGAHFSCPHDYAADERDAIDLILWLILGGFASVLVLVAGAYFIHSTGGSDSSDRLQDGPPPARVNQMMQAQPVAKAGVP